MKATITGNKLVLELPIDPNPQPSKSGKTFLVAGTGGFIKTTAIINGKSVSVAVNATIPRA